LAFSLCLAALLPFLALFLVFGFFSMPLCLAALLPFYAHTHGWYSYWNDGAIMKINVQQ
jgi:hypothetical protein